MLRKTVRPLAIAATLATLILPTTATAGPVPGFKHPEGIVHPSMDSFPARRSGGLLNEWRFQREWQEIAQSYDAALRFAQCVQRFRPDLARQLLERPIGAKGDRESLVDMAQRNRGCAAEQGAVAPLLLRAALAETLIDRQASLQMGVAAVERRSVGVPDMVDGYPLAAISRCQVHVAPDLVVKVLQTTPGEDAERVATETLFGAVPECGASKLGRLAPTASRLALIDAAYRRAVPAEAGR